MPTFSPETMLIDALSLDEAYFDRLASAYPVYRKFAKALLREDTAGRLTLSDVAHMAGLPVADVVDAVAGSAGGTGAGAAPLPEGKPAWAEAPRQERCQFDARPLLEAGHEPLPALLSFVEAAAPSALLVVDATFHPQPLRRLFEGRGYETAAECLGADHWRVYMRRSEQAGSDRSGSKSRRSVPLVYSCSGCSSAAQMANHLAIRLDRAALAEMSCIAGVGGGVPSLVRVAKSGRPIVAIDGCPLRCVENCLARHGVRAEIHYDLSKLGIKKRFKTDYDLAQADDLLRRISDDMAKAGIAAPAPIEGPV